jgi:predicted outer membrane protein
MKEIFVKKTISTLGALVFLASIAVAQDKPAAQPMTKPAATADPIIMAAGDISVKQSEFESAI